MLKQAGILVFVAFAVALLSAAFGRGSFESVILAICLVFLMLVAGFVGLGLMFFGRSTSMKSLGAWVCLVGVAVVGGCLLSLAAGAAVNRADIDRAKRYCEALCPALERHAAATGAYPERISEIRLPAPLPRLLDGHAFYSTSSGGGYYFIISDPSGIMNGFEYDSRSGTWREWD